MTTWHQNEDVSCCELDGRLIFLDIGRDRYFQLSASSEQRFLRLMEQPGSIDPSNVSRHKLFSRLPLSRATPEWAAPTQSALEAADRERASGGRGRRHRLRFSQTTGPSRPGPRGSA